MHLLNTLHREISFSSHHAASTSEHRHKHKHMYVWDTTSQGKKTTGTIHGRKTSYEWSRGKQNIHPVLLPLHVWVGDNQHFHGVFFVLETRLSLVRLGWLYYMLSLFEGIFLNFVCMYSTVPWLWNFVELLNFVDIKWTTSFYLSLVVSFEKEALQCNWLMDACDYLHTDRHIFWSTYKERITMQFPSYRLGY